MKYSKKAIMVLNVISMIFMLLMCSELFLRYPVNHGGGFYCYLPIILLLNIIHIVMFAVFKCGKFGMFVSFICLLIIVFSDLFNLYVHYDVWVKRGMPNFGEFKVNNPVGDL